jgi:hypothetical protein
VLPETTAIVVLGLVDMALTCYLISTGQAHEGNPLMAGVLSRWGPAGLIAAKAGLLAAPVALLECARSQRPALVRGLLRLALAVYAALWGYGVLQLSLSY